jgi:3'(2'), 5'-bisphosphate nucleotidase
MRYMVHEELDEVKRIAREAGAILLRYYRRSTDVEWKSPGDPVTVADKEASAHIVSELRRLFPDDGILSEELPDTSARLSKSRVWMIDPMDGTREFIAHRDEFAVMIGLAIDGAASLGVVYQPTSDKLYSAAPGLGSFLNGAPLRVSPEKIAANLTIAVSRSHRSARIGRICDAMSIRQSIQTGSVGLKVGLIVEGKAHLYIQAGNQTHLWDTCGPEAILKEAGGRMTDIHGDPLLYSGREVRNMRGVVASNGVIHDRAARVAQSVIVQ